MPFPVIGGIIAAGARRILPAAGRIAGRALRAATKGKLIGSGGGRELARTAGRIGLGGLGAAGTVVATRDVVRAARGPSISATATIGEDGEPKKYRRMNPTNARALRRAMRRLEGAEKIFRKVFAFNHGKAPVKVRPKRKGK